MSSIPPWWTPDMPESVQRRESMAGVERWQTVYVRYKSQAEAQVTQGGWDLATSQRLHDAAAVTEQQPFLNEDHPLYSGFAPTHVNLRIIESPAEFAVPVKQDRRLTPNFKVRVEVQYRTRVSFPLTLKAYIITQQEKDSLQDWVPDDYLETDLPQRKPVTELKGTTCITHHFEASMNGAMPSSKVNGMGGNSMMSTISTGFNFPGAGPPQAGLFGQFPSGGQGFADFPPLFQQDGMPGFSKADSLGLNQALFPGMWPEQEGQGQLFEQLFSGPNGKGLPDGIPASAAAAAAMSSMKQEQQGSIFGSGPLAGSQQGLDGQLMQEFEFSNLEFLKPTRMNKVYIVFACNILDQDLLWCVYNIPTVGICRAEQRVKACQKLGITMSDANGHAESQVPALLDASNNVLQQSKVLQRKRNQMQHDPFEELNGAVHKAFETGDLDDMTLDALTNGSLGHGLGSGQGPPRSRMALRELILEQFEATGLTRKLNALDLQALESHAGFPGDVSSDHATISQVQWDEFYHQFQAVLLLLRTVAGLWNQEDPCIIAGFDMDRLGTVHALSKEPAGTFIVRFSLSQPGSLVLTCKVPFGNPNADADGLVHAIIQIEDLHHKRVDTWVRDFPGATHALDVYKQKRVDKRKVFHANYTRLRTMEAVGITD